jgi:tRNA A-37 threonylcarbamoyl transferase component Bud32
MFDFRENNFIDLSDADVLKADKAYKIIDKVTGKPFVVKLMEPMADAEKELLVEFRKLALLSAEPEFATVRYLATTTLNGENKSCYVVDFVEGKSLAEFLAGSEFIDEEVAFDIICQLASGLEKAHASEIFHCDLHDENIQLDQFMNLKIIDPLWRDIGTSIVEKQKKDVEDFKNIVNSIIAKIDPASKTRMSLIESICDNVVSFRGVKKNLERLWEVSKELNSLSTEALGLFSVIKQHVIKEFKLNMVIQEKNIEVPANLLPDLTEKEKEHLQKVYQPGQLQLLRPDTRAERIQVQTVGRLFDIIFHELEMAGLCEYEMGVKHTENGKKLEGPYVFNYIIKLTSKALNWIYIDERNKFLPQLKRQTIHAYIFNNVSF